MPNTSWSGPSSSEQNDSSLTTSSFVTATLTDISPAPCVIPAASLLGGTRIRLHATGNYTATTTASALTWGFYLSPVTGISGTASALLCATASTAAVVATAWPFILDYSGVVNEASISANLTTGKVTGQGYSLLPASLTTFTGPIPMPLTAAARTVSQSATVTGLNTLTTLIAQLGITVATNTGFSNVVVDELTCEVIG
jgi:hypothetical protein